MKRLLIANRGEIARRVIRTARRMGIYTVAVYSDADRGALYVREADSAVALGGLASADSYLRIDRLIEAAHASGADAVHPGYGFLSENADFAQAVADAGLTWIGPPPPAIRALGSKSAAKALAERQGVPVLPGYYGDDQSDEIFGAEAARIGYPLMVKAVAGGGGRGMRLVTEAAQLLPALQSARSEAVAGFGDGRLLIERAVRRPRHVEVQVFADTQGQCIHLGERDCSVQRRHQKIIEEAPSPAVSPALRERLGQAAVALASGAGYVGAGTVEFLLDEDGAFYLMEMNTRLQVEHPVTEMVTGLDLVEWQLRVARGEPLPLAQDEVRLSGHAIEVRLCAEDENFTPHTGTVRRFRPPPTDAGLRFDHALDNGSEVTPHYDAMLGKLIAHAPTRSEAIDRLAQGLAQLQVLGLPTNRAFLAACLQHPVFRAGQAVIPFLAEHGDEVRGAIRPSPQASLVAALAAAYADRPPADALPLPFGRELRMEVDGHAPVMPLRVQETGQGSLAVTRGEEQTEVDWAAWSPGEATLVTEGRQWRAALTCCEAPDGRPSWHVQVDGDRDGTAMAWDMRVRELTHVPARQASSADAARELRAPFNGKLVAVLAVPGQTIARGAPLLSIESMKIEHQIAAPRDGTIGAVHVAAGQQVAPGQLLVSFADTPANAQASA